MRARRALPGGRLDAQNDTLIPGRILRVVGRETGIIDIELDEFTVFPATIVQLNADT